MTIHHDAPSRRLRCLARIAGIVTVLTLCACSGAEHPPAGPPEKITIAFATLPETTLAQVAQSRGYYRGEGLEATAHLHPYGKLALNELLEGKADFATVAETPFMFAAMNGAKVAVIATIHSSTLGHAILARRDRGILTHGDLKGKKIAATLGTTSHFFLDTMLVTHGIPRKDVKIVDLKAEQIPDALVRGDIDAVSAFSPYMEQTQKKLGDRAVVFHDKDIYRYTFNVVARQEYIRENPGTIRKLLRALVRAEQFVRENPVAAQKTVSDFSRIDLDILRDTWANATFSVSLDQSLLLALEDESQWAINSGLTDVRRVPNYLDFIYLDGLRAIKPAAVRILR
jgi:NitT/TauT family transport system substrate-binding protein